MLQALGAERSVLAILMKQPDLFFDVDDFLEASDFTNIANELIYSAIGDIVTTDKSVKLDTYTIISHAESRGLTSLIEHTHGGELLDALEITKKSIDVNSLGKHAAAVKKAAIKRNTISLLEALKDDIEDFSGPAIDLKNMVEDKVLGSIKVMDSGEDSIQVISDGFEDTINAYADGDGIIGLDIGLERWQRDCGGIRNGTVTGIFARAKAGKSQIAAHAAKKIAIDGDSKFGKLPVLYLDTELQLRNQQMRICSMMTGISYGHIESGAWKSNREEIDKIKNAFENVKGAPFYYKNIAGRSVNYVIPIIRKFVHKYGGGYREGDEPRCLIIYDYIKLMSPDDLKSAQEYQMLGFLLSKIHDLASDLNVPILAFGQLNKEAYRIDSEIAVAGADRLNWNLDSVTIFRKKRPEEIAADGKERGNHILKVALARSGSGHEYNDWINLHFDKSRGAFKEDKRNLEIIEAIQNLSAVRSRLEEEDIEEFASLRED